MALAGLFQPVLDRFLRLFDGHAGHEAGVDHNAGLAVGEGFLLDVAAFDDLDHRDAELPCELPVAGVVGRDGHDGAGAVAGEDVVGDIDRDFGVVDGIDALYTFKADAGLFLAQFGPLKVGLFGRFRLVGLHLVHILDDGGPFLDHRVFRRDDHIGRAEEGVGASGVDGQGVAGGGAEVHLGAGRAANPVDLGRLDPFKVVDVLQVIQQPLGVGGDFQHPLALFLVDDGGAAALADAVDHLFIGEDALAAGAPVDVHLALIGEPRLEHLEEDPLGPLVVVGVGGVHFPVPIEGEAEAFQLLLKVGDVFPGDLGRMDVVLDREVFGRQAEGVPAHREEDVVALQPPLAGNNVHRGVGAGMADVEALSGGIGELDQRVEFGLGVVDLRMEGLMVVPILLPLFFD